jgi:PiT family inorganic phosphate transporter
MLILMGLVPAGFALDRAASPERLQSTREATAALTRIIEEHGDEASTQARAATKDHLERVRTRLEGVGAVVDIPREERFAVRHAIMLADRSIEELDKAGALGLDADQRADLKKRRAELRGLIEYAPSWVLVCVALALGIGTTVGWKRIVVTVGEKIGKAHLTYAQGASAELVAMSTVGLSAWLGLPVSTTHVLSSGIAGTMVAHGSGVQRSTVKNIALAWLLTLPVSMLLSALLFTLLRRALA